MPQDAALPPAGWYPDPYEPDSVRWFDGSLWTVHAVPADSPRPDEAVTEAWEGRTDEELRARERLIPYDLSTARPGARPYDGGGGRQGLSINRAVRGTMRAGSTRGPVSATRWVAGVTLILALLAWGDPRHRVVLGATAVLGFVATVIVAIRELRARTYWRRAGRSE